MSAYIHPTRKIDLELSDEEVAPVLERSTDGLNQK